MKRIIIVLAAATAVLNAAAQTDTYIKLNDAHGKHPRVMSLTYPGNADNLDMYNSIYGHGGVIENPWVAFRIYMDNRQSLDLYVKQTPQLELDRTGFYTTPEQIAQGYGCDVLWAGPSVSAGAFRGWDGSKPLTIDSVATRTQTVMSPSCLEVVDEGWIVNGHRIDMIQSYTVDPATRDLKVEIQLSGYTPDDIFCTGVQKLESNNKGFVNPRGIAASWGSNVPDKQHSELVEQVGLAVLVDPANVAGTTEDDLNYLVLLKPDADGVIRYTVRAAGDRERGGYKNADAWLSHISDSWLK